MSRAKYILSEEHGIDALAEMVREKDFEVMEWVFETRMEIEELEHELELTTMLGQIQNEYEEKIAEITNYFATGDHEKVKSELEKTQYLSQMLADIELKIVQVRDKSI